MNLVQMDGQYTLTEASGRIYGVVVGIVTANHGDPDGLGRVKVRFPWLAKDAESAWARIATLMAGNNRGSFFLPEVEDEVLVAFEHGDSRYPYILGALWNGKDKPPDAIPDGQAKPPATNADGQENRPNRRLLKSLSGMTLLFDDTAGSQKIEIADRGGRHRLVVDMAHRKIIITAEGDIDITAPQGAITISGKALNLRSTEAMEVKATGTLNVQGQTVNIKGQPMVNINPITTEVSTDGSTGS
jgi:uncharacterized protein involved in type VI secretion and phage assembly